MDSETTPMEEPDSQQAEPAAPSAETEPVNNRERALGEVILAFLDEPPSDHAWAGTLEMIRQANLANRERAAQSGLSNDKMAEIKLTTTQLAEEMGMDPVQLWGRVEEGIAQDRQAQGPEKQTPTW